MGVWWKRKASQVVALWTRAGRRNADPPCGCHCRHPLLHLVLAAGSRPFLLTSFASSVPNPLQDVELRSPDTREAGMPQHAPGGVEQGEPHRGPAQLLTTNCLTTNCRCLQVIVSGCLCVLALHPHCCCL